MFSYFSLNKKRAAVSRGFKGESNPRTEHFGTLLHTYHRDRYDSCLPSLVLILKPVMENILVRTAAFGLFGKATYAKTIYFNLFNVPLQHLF
jgi:hypothetical protein